MSDIAITMDQVYRIVGKLQLEKELLIEQNNVELSEKTQQIQNLREAHEREIEFIKKRNVELEEEKNDEEYENEI